MKNQVKFFSFILFINYTLTVKKIEVTESVVRVLVSIDTGGTAWCFHDIQLILSNFWWSLKFVDYVAS